MATASSASSACARFATAPFVATTPRWASRWASRCCTSASWCRSCSGVSPAGSHKPNTAIAQAFYNKQEGVKRITTETGAGQWGSSIALACQLFGLECTVYMVKVSFHQKPYRKSMMQLWGAEVLASPVDVGGKTVPLGSFVVQSTVTPVREIVRRDQRRQITLSTLCSNNTAGTVVM